MDENISATPESASVDTSTTTSADLSSNTSTPSAESTTTTTTDSASDIKVVVDENGNRSIELNQNPFSTEQEVAAEPNAQSQPEVNYYADMNEIMQAAATNTLDESRISEEQKQTIMQVQAQEQARQQAALARQQALEQQNAQLLQARQQAFTDIAKQSREAALKAAGITEEDLANADYIENGDTLKQKFEEAYNANLMQGQYKYVQQEMAQQQQMQEYNTNMGEILRFCAAEKQSNPQYAEIIKSMDTAKFNLPYNQAQEIIEAERHIQNHICTQKDLQVFRNYFDSQKKAIIQNTRGVSNVPRRTAPPKVEATGQPRGSASPQFDAKAVRAMNSGQRGQYMTNWIASLM